MNDILSQVDPIESDYVCNCPVTCKIAAESFVTERVVGSLINRAAV